MKRGVVAVAVVVLLSSVVLAVQTRTAFGAGNSLSISLDASTVSASDRGALESFLQEAVSKLPPAMIRQLAHPIVIGFQQLNAQDEIIPVCAGSQDVSKKPQMRGKAVTSKSSSKPHRIYLDHSFIREIVVGESRSRTYPCGHRNLYRLAFATLIHEIGHLYDNIGPLTTEESERYDRCLRRQLETTPDQPSDPTCANYDELEKSVSSRLAYQQLASWKAGMFDAEAKNKFRGRSPDPYEFKNIREHFAVNLEYFLLDPDYACRRPALHQFLEDHFGFRAFPVGACGANQLVYLSSSDIGNDYKRFVSIDPKRVYQVHYLLAGKGEAMMSRWGHAMLRLVVCAPERETVGPGCLDDTAHHLVISFRANVTDMILNAAKGFFGGYPSQLFVYRLSEIIQEYTAGELRILLSAPLILTDRQKDLLVNRALEQSWEYLGNYTFLTNNCATEVLDLLKGIVPEERIRELIPMSPLGLYEGLAEKGLTDLSPLADLKSARKKGYYFESKASVFAKVFETLKPYKIGFKNWKKFEEETTPVQRRALYESLVAAHPEMKEPVAAAFFTLESYGAHLSQQALQAELTALLERFTAGKTDGIRRLESLEKLVALLGAKLGRAPWKKLKQGYGIPLREEIAAIPLMDETASVGMSEEVAAFLQDNLPELSDRIEKIESNKKHFKAAIVGAAAK